MGRIKAWLKRVRDRWVDRLALLVWEGFCRLDLLSEMEVVASLSRRQPARQIQVDVGKTEGATSNLRRVEFRGEQLAEAQSSVGDFRMQETLYRTQPGKLLVHVKALEKSAGFPTEYTLYEIEEADLDEGGLHEELGKARGTLSLAEVLGE